MKGMTTLGQVWDRVHALSRHCTDRLISTPDIDFGNLKTVRIAGAPHPLRPTAQSLIASRLGIPMQYLQRCPVEVQAYNLNFWIKQERNQEMFFRFDGDRITPGISISNSEVGLSSLRIAAFYLRLICTNGLIAKTQVAVAYRHVSRKILDDFPTVFAGVSRQMLQQREQFRLSLDSRVEDPVETIKAFNRQFQLTEKEQEAVAWGWMWEPGHTMFNILNAYTRGALHNGLPASASYRLQTVGGQILAMVK